MLKLIISSTPVWFQNILISIYNTKQYKSRQSGCYDEYFEYYRKYNHATSEELNSEINRRYEDFLNASTLNSNWYRRFSNYKELTDFSILEKKDLIENLNEIATIPVEKAIVSLTGGTTGASMRVYKTKEDIQERHALLDYFRSTHDYTLGKKCAWFSGKNIVTEKNLAKGICYRDDYINRIRFFSTFHIIEDNFDIYWKAFCKFTPEFIVGFPSSVYELCSMASIRGLKLEKTVKVFFPTAETLLPIHREVIQSVLGCKIIDQYASSEGAPFILECGHGGLHIHPLTGIFEVVNEGMEPAEKGEILVTSFTTKGTPLIRYRIGDRIQLSAKDKQCACGSLFPLVERIEGRTTDYILSPTHGKVNLGNISNSTKGVNGLISFQIIQRDLKSVDLIIVGNVLFKKKDEDLFLAQLIERLGCEIKINVKKVDEIKKEKSGKFRIVKNLLNLEK